MAIFCVKNTSQIYACEINLTKDNDKILKGLFERFYSKFNRLNILKKSYVTLNRYFRETEH